MSDHRCAGSSGLVVQFAQDQDRKSLASTLIPSDRYAHDGPGGCKGRAGYWRRQAVVIALFLILNPVLASIAQCDLPLFAGLLLDVNGPPLSLAIGDFNADGKPDLVTADNGSNTVSVLLGNGDGTFGPKTDFGAGSWPTSVATGDLDSDGKPDLAVANSGANTVSVLLGNGDGTFGPKTDFDTGSAPSSVAIGDLNNDGNPDLAVANSGAFANSVSVLLGNGDGSFGARTDFDAGSNPSSVAIGDLNGDGRPDLATANAGSNTVSVLLGNGGGDFAAPTDYATGNARSVAIGDLNNDGKPDLAVASYWGVVSVLLGNGDGSFGTKTDFATGSNPYSVAIGDLNADGRSDLAVANYGSNTVSVLLGNGDGSFGLKTDFGTQFEPWSIAIGDLNGDGKPDLAVANSGSNTVSVLLGNGDGSFATRADYATGNAPSSVAIGDLNGDARLDLAVANSSSNTVSVLLGSGNGSFDAKTDFGTGTQPRSVAIGDVNGDGHPDLATANYSAKTVSVLLGNGDGTFGPKTDFGIGSAPSWVAIGDLNSDGKPDLVTAGYYSSYWGVVSVLLGNGDGSLAAPSNYLPGLDPRCVAIGDLNNDGNLDLAVANAGSNTVSVLLGNGDGSFSTRTDYATGNYPLCVVIRDLNADGKPDLTVANPYSNTVSVLLGNGDGTFASKTDYATGNHPVLVAIGDLNSNSKPDLVTANSAANTVSVLLGNGDGSFDTKTDFSTGSNSSSVAIGDLNSDGKPDLAVANSGANTVSVLLNRGCGSETFPTASILPLCGAVGAIFSGPGAGFTPNSEVELHLLLPDGTPDLPNLVEHTDACGSFTHSYDSSPVTHFGAFSYYAIDLATGRQSNTFNFTILPADRPSPPPGVHLTLLSGSGGLHLEWNPSPSPFVDCVDVYRMMDGGPLSLLTTLLPSVQSLDDTGLESGHTYSYLLRARDCVGPGPFSTAVSGSPNCSADFVVDGLEVIQAVPASRLVKWKTTVVRAYFHNSGAPLGADASLQARLSIRYPNQQVVTRTLAQPFIWPKDGRFTDTQKRQGLNTCNFFLDGTDIDSSPLDFWVDIDTDNSVCESNEDNNSSSATPFHQAFFDSKPLRIAYCTISSQPTAPPDLDLSRAGDLVFKTYPIVRETGDWTQLPHIPWDPWNPVWGNVPLSWQRAANAKLNRLLEKTNNSLPPNQQYKRLVGFFLEWPIADAAGQTLKWTEQVCLLDASSRDLAQAVAHELGHTFLLRGEYYNPPKSGSSEWRADDQTLCWKRSDCPPDYFPCRNYPPKNRDEGLMAGRFVDESSFDPDPAVRQPAGWGKKDDFIGALQPAPHNRQPNTSGDCVGYFTAEEDDDPLHQYRRIGFMGNLKLGAGYAWITPDDYDVLADQLLNPGTAPQAPAVYPVRAATDSEQVWVFLEVTSAGTAYGYPWWQESSSLPVDVPPGTGYTFDLRGAGDVLLLSLPFGVDLLDPDTTLVTARLPFLAGTERIDVRKEGVLIYSRAVSAHAPQVTLTSPNGGMLAGTVSVTWNATDADGDSLVADVEFSNDGGITWQTVGDEVRGGFLDWDTSQEPGTVDGRLRVRVSDGLLTAEGVSDAQFTIGKKLPVVSISSPQTADSLLAGVPFTLQGTLFDAEAGYALSTNLAWRSSLDGLLGSGAAVAWTPTTPGVHTLAAIGVDADSNAAVDSISVVVLADSDGDGMPDIWESAYPGLDPAVRDAYADADGDSLANLDEYLYHTSPVLADTDGDGFSDYREIQAGSDPLSPVSVPVGVDGLLPPPLQVAILSYPNPFRTHTMIRYAVPKTGDVDLGVFDVAGRKVAQLAKGIRSPGVYEQAWNGQDRTGSPVRPGVFFLRLRAPGGTMSAKAVRIQ